MRQVQVCEGAIKIMIMIEVMVIIIIMTIIMQENNKKPHHTFFDGWYFHAGHLRDVPCRTQRRVM